MEDTVSIIIHLVLFLIVLLVLIAFDNATSNLLTNVIEDLREAAENSSNPLIKTIAPIIPYMILSFMAIPLTAGVYKWLEEEFGL